jgi:hypothetical protein
MDIYLDLELVKLLVLVVLEFTEINNMDGFTPEFKILWDTEVKAHIKKCTPEFTILCTLPGLPEEMQKAALNKLQEKGYVDVMAQYFIGRMVGAVEHALADDRKDLGFIQSFSQIHGTLNDKDYWENFPNKETEEAKNLLKLRDYINRLAEMVR